LVPYAGGFAGFMPYRMDSGGALAFRPRPGSAMGPTRASFRLSSSGGMAPGRRSSLNMGLRSGTSASSTMRPAPAGSGVMPPNFGYPFRQPPMPGATSTGTASLMP